MSTLINNKFLLNSPSAERLYFDYAKDCPIVDYHCHIDAKDIAQDVSFHNLTELWLKGDHYKWRLMRSAGVDEKYITGDADDYEKYMAWVKVIENAIGNPLYHWTNLELLRYFDISEPLTSANAEKIWNQTCTKLESGLTARMIIQKSNVELICTTDDPIDDLRWHKMIDKDLTFTTTVLPTFRPDHVVDIEKSGFITYLQALAKTTGIEIKNWYDLKIALRQRMDYFGQCGCRLADHGMGEFVFGETSDNDADTIIQKRLSYPKMRLSEEETVKFKSAILLFFATEYAERGWTMQLHFGCLRDVNESTYRTLGINTGFDTIAGATGFVPALANFMSILTLINKLPSIILYSLNPGDNTILDTLIGCFQDGSRPMKIQHGAAWWFNDNLHGIEDHLRSLAAQSYLPGFAGMLTDSRSLLSYTRHEYFRRILCNYFGDLIEKGQFAKDMDRVGKIVTDICYNNALSMFESVLKNAPGSIAKSSTTSEKFGELEYETPSFGLPDPFKGNSAF